MKGTEITRIGIIYHLFTPEIPRDITSLPSILKHIRVSCIRSILPRIQLFERRLALNPGLNLNQVYFSCFHKHFLG